MLNIFLLLIALMVCITVHEAAHAWVAYKLGDPTPKVDGRVSLNPGRHLDLLGTLLIFVIHFGWGKPVVFNPHNLKHPKRDSALIAVAGPMTNLLTAAVLLLVIKYFSIPSGSFAHTVLEVIYSMSIGLFVFNLIPIAPLDGSKFIGIFIPASLENAYQNYLAQGPIYLLIIIIGDRIIDLLTGISFLGFFLSYGYDGVNTFLNLLS